MKCRYIHKKLSLYLDGLLDAEESVSIKEHLESCESCSRDFDELQKIQKDLQSLEPHKAPDSLLSSINESIDKEIADTGITHTLKKFFDYISMRHAVEAAGVFAAAAILVVLLLPTVKNTIPQMSEVHEKRHVLDQKTLSKRDFEAEKPSHPAPVDKFAGSVNKTFRPEKSMKDAISNKADKSPIIISFTTRRDQNISQPLALDEADDASEELRVERKRADSPAGMRSSKKSKSYASREYAGSAKKSAQSDSFMYNAPAMKKQAVREETASKIRAIARSFGADVRKLDNKKVLEITIKGTQLNNFLNELRKIGLVKVVNMKGNTSMQEESLLLHVSYEKP